MKELQKIPVEIPRRSFRKKYERTKIPEIIIGGPEGIPWDIFKGIPKKKVMINFWRDSGNNSKETFLVEFMKKFLKIFLKELLEEFPPKRTFFMDFPGEISEVNPERTCGNTSGEMFWRISCTICVKILLKFLNTKALVEFFKESLWKFLKVKNILKETLKNAWKNWRTLCS